MAVKVGINGFGRIGRNVFRTALGNPEIEFVAVNDLTSPATLAHLLKYDSILGNLKNEVSVEGRLHRGRRQEDQSVSPSATPPSSTGLPSAPRLSSNRPASSPMPKRPRRILGFGTVKKVIISAPATNEDLTVVLGVNDDKYEAAKHNVISNASCTTNCLAPVVKVLHDTFGIAAAS